MNVLSRILDEQGIMVNDVQEALNLFQVWLGTVFDCDIVPIAYYEEGPSEENNWNTTWTAVVKYNDAFFAKEETEGSYGAIIEGKWFEVEEKEVTVKKYVRITD